MKELSKSGLDNLAAGLAMLALAFFTVCVRFIVRFRTRQSIASSDWFILLGFACHAVFMGLLANYIIAGPGPGTFEMGDFTKYAADGGLDWAVSFLKTLYIADLFFMASLTFVKVSILALFHSIFGISIPFRRWNYLTAALCLIWFVVVFFMNAFQCTPVHMLWDAMGSPEYCLASGRLWLGMEITNLFLDVMMIALPLVMVNTLKLNRARKFQISGIFLLGFLACVASIIKLAYLWIPETPALVNAPMTMIWSSVQLGVATLCACLPTYAALFNRARVKISNSRQSRQSRQSRKPFTSSGRAKYSLSQEHSLIHSGDGSVLGASSYFQISNEGNKAHQMERLKPGAIYVKRSVDVNVT